MPESTEEMLEPDRRHRAHMIFDDELSAYRPITLQDYYGPVGGLAMAAGTPKEVRSQFDKARSAFRQSWFDYELTALAELQAYVVVEFALRMRLEEETDRHSRWTLHRLLEEAVARGWLRDSGFQIDPQSRPPGQAEVGLADTEQPAASNPQAYCRILIDALPRLRNDLAHGSPYLNFPGGAVFTLKLCADIINQLYSEPAAARGSG